MNIKLNNSQNKTKSCFLLLGALMLSACSTTQKANITQSDVNCAFLGKDCSLLTIGSKEQTGLRYVNGCLLYTSDAADE